ncbi:MAG: Uma2 family endonuclease [Okeania sp. SIO3C4]|nr:Uma2 family endonuclease [Okeania sp. SIO3B3]NER02742.1 Uma2 family endonuclease [Okeania sp. SIO3C4]
MNSFTIDFDSVVELTDEQFFQLCQKNQDLRFERNAKGDLIIMSPAGTETGNRNGRLTQQLFNWADRNELGIPFDSSAGFNLPNGENRSPDAAWVPIEKWNNLTPEQRTKFSPICPDFLVELMSPSDSLSETRKKMKEYLENGMILGWLINRETQKVEIYRQGKDVEILDSPEILSGEDVLPGFILDMTRIW